MEYHKLDNRLLPYYHIRIIALPSIEEIEVELEGLG